MCKVLELYFSCVDADTWLRLSVMGYGLEHGFLRGTARSSCDVSACVGQPRGLLQVSASGTCAAVRRVSDRDLLQVISWQILIEHPRSSSDSGPDTAGSQAWASQRACSHRTWARRVGVTDRDLAIQTKCKQRHVGQPAVGLLVCFLGRAEGFGKTNHRTGL